jgi:hypothetical protein
MDVGRLSLPLDVWHFIWRGRSSDLLRVPDGWSEQTVRVRNKSLDTRARNGRRLDLDIQRKLANLIDRKRAHC